MEKVKFGYMSKFGIGGMKVSNPDHDGVRHTCTYLYNLPGTCTDLYSAILELTASCTVGCYLAVSLCLAYSIHRCQVAGVSGVLLQHARFAVLVHTAMINECTDTKWYLDECNNTHICLRVGGTG